MATQTPQTVVERSTLVEVAQLAADVRAEVGKAFYGGPEPIELILTTLMARGHVLLEGVPGIAKTTLVKAFAAALGCSFRRIQFTPDLLPSDITGTYVLSAGTFALREGPIFAQVILADEVNRAPAKTQSALLEAMQERQVTIEGQTRALEPPFFVLATQNPIEHEGTYPLPEAQVDRFLAKLKMGYPSGGDEKEMLRRYAASGAGDTALQTRRVLEPGTILRLQELADAVHVEDELLDYVIALASFTRTHRRVALGASPRAALQLVHASKARALLGGRDFVLPDDVKYLGPSVLSHRVMLSADAELEGMSADAVVREALDRVPYRGRPRG
jgi:MoxR-like ATPase